MDTYNYMSIYTTDLLTIVWVFKHWWKLCDLHKYTSTNTRVHIQLYLLIWVFKHSWNLCHMHNYKSIKTRVYIKLHLFILTFSLKQMALRKITIDNSVIYVKKIANHKVNLKQNWWRIFHFLVNKTKLFHKIAQNSLIIYQHQDSENFNE